jgi:hypothetical protein
VGAWLCDHEEGMCVCVYVLRVCVCVCVICVCVCVWLRQIAAKRAGILQLLEGHTLHPECKLPLLVAQRAHKVPELLVCG